MDYKEFLQRKHVRHDACGFDVDESDLNPRLFDWQRKVVRWAIYKGQAALFEACGLGKALACDEPILTPGGWQAIGNSRIGDLVFGSDGKPHKIIGVYHQGLKKTAKVTFSDGTEIVCDYDHLWKVYSQSSLYKGHKGKVLTTKQIIENGIEYAGGQKKHFIPIVKPLDFGTNNELPIDPYTLGVLLGDGSFRCNTPSITTPDKEVIDQLIIPDGCEIKLHKPDVRCDEYSIVGGEYSNSENPIKTILVNLGLYGKLSIEKHIPHKYLIASVKDRLSLVQGLLDTDGHANGPCIEFCSSSKMLSSGLIFLVRSLGGTATYSEETASYKKNGEKIECESRHRSIIKLPNGFAPFRLKRKLNKYKPIQRKNPLKSIVKIEDFGENKCVCIRVDSPDNLFVTRGVTLTHNTPQQLEWARVIHKLSGGDVLILAPLAVAAQTAREGRKFGIDVTVCRGQEDVQPGINVTNYEMLGKFEPDHFTGVVLDECFPPDTPIDVFNIDKSLTYKYIKDINKTDILYNAYGEDEIEETYKRPIKRAVQVCYNGRIITCSENHPFFTVHGWRCAQDLRPGDYLVATGEAMRLVWGNIPAGECVPKTAKVLQSILLSEMENEHSGAQSQSSHKRGCGQEGIEKTGVVQIWKPGINQGDKADHRIESDGEPGNKEKSFSYIAEDEAQTFRSWGKWSLDDITSANNDGCSIRQLDSGIGYITGKTKTGFSDMLQSRLGESRSKNSNRGRREFPLFEERKGRKEGSNTCFFRVESVEILEQGHPELEKYRDESGVVYFYDIKAKRHPSFSVNGVLVHNSSILKSFMGKTKQAIMEAFRSTPYRLACTATPSPNDLMELLNQADFLGIMPSNEALSRWFINDTMNFGTYRLKGHAEKDFWRWVSTWAVCINKPSDIGFPDDGFVLPGLQTIQHIIEKEHDFENGQLFADYSNVSATDLFKVLRKSIKERTDKAANLINASDETWVVWCNTNDESRMLSQKIFDAVEILGAMPAQRKEQILEDFATGKIRVLVTKASMTGFGLNWQHCRNTAFVGLSYSFEQRYQAIRRFWRFGQEREVYDHVIMAPEEVPIWRTVQKKEAIHQQLEQNMTNNISDYSDLSTKKLKLVHTVKREELVGNNWNIIIGDSCEQIQTIPDESVHFQIFSPPFSNLYIYSDAVTDMGNTKDDGEFFEHFDFLIPELYRILIPGRLCAVHCKDLVDYKNSAGKSGLRDFPGEIIRRFEAHRWKYHSRVTIWKDPVIEMQRTKAQGLLHAQIKRDASMSRQGLPDYLLVFRKWPASGETSGPEPVVRPCGLEYYIGENGPDTEPVAGDDFYSIHVWQRYASPVWFDIQQTNVLNKTIGRDDRDEKHICPLQLDVIKRAVHLWTNAGDTVFTPFAGIGSELYGAVELGRKAIGIELKPSYARAAAKFLSDLENRPEQLQLFG